MWINPPASTLAALLLFACSASAQAAVITAAESASHVGQMVTVQGVVAEVHVTPKGTELLDFDARYPAEDFTAVVFASDAAQVGDINHFWGKRTSVTGKVELYKGRPEIIVRSADALKILP